MDTIVAIATASGVGSIAIIRLSGDKSLEIAKTLTKKSLFTPRYTHLCNIYSKDNSLIDEAIVIHFQAPNSYTTENVIEIQCHGGIIVANMIVEQTLLLGARLAEAGEFTKRAFLNGRIDLTKAEAISKLIEAKSIDSAKLLAKQLKGELKEFVEEIRDELLTIIAFVEVNIDYAEEDLPENIYLDITEKLINIEKKLINTLNASERRESMFNGFKVSIVGKPNVGKSSLLNKLLNFDRAIVSDIAGTTRDTIEESIKIGTHLIKIVDTAGIRDETKDKIEQIGIGKSIESIEESEIVIAIFDLSRDFDREDEKILTLLNRYKKDKEIIVILNKSDLTKKLDIEKLKEFNLLHLNCIDGESEIQNLVLKLQNILDNFSSVDDLMLISKRQIDSVKRAIDSIDNSKIPLESGELELFAFELNSAIKSISEISRPIEYDEVLDKLFGNFCLGK